MHWQHPVWRAIDAQTRSLATAHAALTRHPAAPVTHAVPPLITQRPEGPGT